MMFKLFKGIGMITILLCCLSDTYAQKTTEIFIPLGRSPGLSGKYTVIGEIKTVNQKDLTISLKDSTGTYTMKITEDTKIWLDRSNLKLTNQKGTFADCQEGLLAEVKYKDNERKDKTPVEWVKLQIVE